VSVRIAPSILSADFARLADAIAHIEAGGADLVHVDVMDGHFVPNITIGPPVVAALKRVTKLPLDVHLMITDPDRYLEAFVQAGASMLTVHAEVLPHLHRTLTQIRSLGVKAGVAINPSTPVSAISDVTAQMDHLLVMSVNPGFGGQTFIPHSLAKITAARAARGQRQPGGHRGRWRRGSRERRIDHPCGRLDPRGGRVDLWHRRRHGSHPRAAPRRRLNAHALLGHHSAREVRRNGSHGRRLLRQLLRLVRGRARGFAAHARLDVP